MTVIDSDNKLDLHSIGTPNGRRVTVLLKHLNVPFQYGRIDITKQEQFSKSFKGLNPCSKIPVIEDHDPFNNEPVVIFESCAILLFSAEKYDTQKKIHYTIEDGPVYWDQMKWLFFTASDLSPSQGQLSFYRNFAPVQDDFAIQRSLQETEKVYDALELRLNENKGWLVSQTLNIADVAAYAFVKRSSFVKLDVEHKWPQVWNYLEKLDKIQGFQEGYHYDALG